MCTQFIQNEELTNSCSRLFLPENIPNNTLYVFNIILKILIALFEDPNYSYKEKDVDGNNPIENCSNLMRLSEENQRKFGENPVISLSQWQQNESLKNRSFEYDTQYLVKIMAITPKKESQSNISGQLLNNDDPNCIMSAIQFLVELVENYIAFCILFAVSIRWFLNKDLGLKPFIQEFSNSKIKPLNPSQIKLRYDAIDSIEIKKDQHKHKLTFHVKEFLHLGSHMNKKLNLGSLESQLFEELNQLEDDLERTEESQHQLKIRRLIDKLDELAFEVDQHIQRKNLLINATSKVINLSKEILENSENLENIGKKMFEKLQILKDKNDLE